MKSSWKTRIAWNTPLKYIEAARVVMGGIDLDPATDVDAQARIQASKYHTIEDDGLVQDWAGRVWLNPPYTPIEKLRAFARKAMDELGHGAVTQLIFMTNTECTWVEWFQELGRKCDALCFHHGRVEWEAGHKAWMMDVDGVTKLPVPLELNLAIEAEYSIHGSVFFYFGHNGARFRQIFSQWGFVK